MFLSTAHVHRLIVSGSLALVLILSTTVGGQAQTAGVYELAFVRDGEIFKVRSDGTGLVQLTSDGMNSEPAWSPDGSRIAFVHSDGNSGGSQIYVMNADGSNVVQRTIAGGSSPAWSPDGTRIAFAGDRIYVMRVDEDWWNPGPLGFDRGWNGQPAWSPDGTRIAFVSDWRAYDILYDLYVMNADGSDLKLLLGGPFFSPWLTYYFQPAWSPDGGTIALNVCPYAWDNCFPDSTVALVNADGSGLRSIASAGGYAHPSWSPDGTIIAFGSSACRECPSTIKYVTRNGSGSGVLVWDAHSPTWRPSTGGQLASPDGTTVPTATQIIDNSGAIWTLGSNTAVLRNGAQVGGAWASTIFWKTSTIYVYGLDLNWWQWTGSTWVNLGPAMPGGTTGGTGSGTTSPDGTMIPTTASQIVDAAGAVWSLGSNTAVLRNGAQVGGAWASRIFWKTSTIYVYGLDLNWWQWTGSTWVNLGPTMPGGTTGGNGSGTPSPDNTTVPTNASQIVDAAGAVWTLGSNTAVLRNGVQVGGAWASTIYWKTSTLYVYGLDLNWWQWTGSGWLNVGPLQP